MNVFEDNKFLYIIIMIIGVFKILAMGIGIGHGLLSGIASAHAGWLYSIVG